MYRVVRNTYHPVVKHYMDVICKAAKETSYGAENVDYKQRHAKNDVIVCDSPVIALHYLVCGYRNLAVWFQGVLPEESFISHHSHVRSFLLGMVEHVVLQRAKCVFLVSEEMKTHYQKKYHVNLENKSFIMPCFNETGLNEAAFADNDEGKTVEFLYAGSLSKWQCFTETADLYSRIERKAKVPVKLLVFTKEKEAAENTVRQFGIRSFEIDYVEPDELAQRIKNCRYGFVVREDTIINQVATPTKFSNYLSNGIIPVFSRCLKSFFRVSVEYGIGIPCDIEDLDTAAQLVLSDMSNGRRKAELKEKCQKVFDDYYSSERYIEKIGCFLNEINWS